MKLKYLAIAAATAAALMATQASATAFFIDYTGVSATNGAFTAHLTGNYAGGVATSISGDRNGIAVTGLSPYAAATQKITGTFPFTDFGGLSYTTLDGISYNFYVDGPSNFEINDVLDPGGFASNDAPISPLAITASVPEPATWAMLLAGFGMIGFGLRSRKRPVTTLTYA